MSNLPNNMVFDLQELESYIAKDLVKKQAHPKLDLSIYNYTVSCQYNSLWDKITLACRGLVLDSEGRVIARPFQKFFNYQEVNSIPSGRVKVSEKLDGSLGILFRYNGELIFASKGSFTSKQAVEFQKIWEEKGYNKLNHLIEEGFTYMFEIIYPSNRIVVDYGSTRSVILIGITNNLGFDVEFKDSLLAEKVEKISCVEFPSFEDVLALPEESNKEGFVIRWPEHGYRLKLKFNEYKKLHALLTNSSPYHIWEVLRDNLPLDSFLENVPDEFYKLVQECIEDFRKKFDNIKEEAENYYNNLGPYSSRKEFAFLVQSKVPKKYKSLMFLFLDKKEYDKVIWSFIEPKNSRSFFQGKI